MFGGVIGVRYAARVCGNIIRIKEVPGRRCRTRHPAACWGLGAVLLVAVLAAGCACITLAGAVPAFSAKPAVGRLGRFAPQHATIAGWSRGADRAVGDGRSAMLASPVDDLAPGSIGHDAGFIEWFERDVEHLKALGASSGGRVGGAANGDATALTDLVAREIAWLREAIAYLDERPSYRDPDLGFSVYDTRATGWLHVLDVALRTREDLLTALRSPLAGWLGAARESAVRDAAAREADSLYRLSDGTPLYDADPSRLPQVDEVVRTLRAMDLPRAAFDGYRVYLLPLSMGDVSGLGAKGYTLIGAAAVGREVIANQVPVTVAHEFGHHIQLGTLGPTYAANPTTWSRYMLLRGIRGWAADGKVNTEAWASSPEETFAEDVRVLFGPPEASQEPFGTAYADPRTDPELAAKVREFIVAQAAAVRPDDAPAAFGADTLAGGGSGSIGSSWTTVKALVKSCYERIAGGP
ncbi:MAG: hypothetical protein ACM3X3_10065 [Betaproteobacteria bacterium]